MATRFYLPSTGSAAVSPAYDSWDNTTSPDSRLKCVTTKISSAIVQGSKLSWTSGEKKLARQYVSDPVAVQTISGTVKMQIGGGERFSDDNVDKSYLSIRVVSEDGNTVRGTLLVLGNYFANVEFNNGTGRNITFANGDSLTSVDCHKRDRIVIELGCSDTGGTSPEAAFGYGDNGLSDLGENETDTVILTKNPWVEFSADIDFNIVTRNDMSAFI